MYIGSDLNLFILGSQDILESNDIRHLLMTYIKLIIAEKAFYVLFFISKYVITLESHRSKF